MNRFVALLLVTVIIFSCLPLQVLAEDGVIGPPDPPNPGKPDKPSNPPSGGGEGGEEPDIVVNVDVIVKNNANTIIMDLAKFNLIGLPYEIEPMKEFLKEMPEYKFGDIIDFKVKQYTLEGRDYYEYEQALMRDGIIRHPSDITYNLNVSKGVFTWNREHNLKLKEEDEISATYFLTSLAREAGMKDNIYISARSTATWVLNKNLTETRFKGRQRIEESPYQKEVQGQVDIGTSIVLVDYDDREYLTIKMDNIYKPYISYLVDMGVLSQNDISCVHGYNYTKTNANTIYGMYRANYNSIPVSKISDIDSDADLGFNEDSTKKFDWEVEQVTLRPYSSSEGNQLQYPIYKLVEDCGHEHHYEYVMEGSLMSPFVKLRAQVPQILKKESITVMEALEYIYKYMKLQETEPILNQLEVDAIISLYGLKLSNYNDDEIKVLKYLIAKGIVNPDEDNLELMRRPLLYKDVLKYLYRLNYPEKRFDFKNLSLTSEDIRMAAMGYMRDTIRFNSNSNSIDLSLEVAKDKLRQAYLKSDEALGYDEIYLEIPNEEYKNNNYILSSSRDLNVKFDTTPISLNGKIYGMAFIPKSFTKGLVLRSTVIEGGYMIFLPSWENGGVYNINTEGNAYFLNHNIYYAYQNPIVNFNRFASSGLVMDYIDINKEYTYKNTPIFVGEQGNRTINPELTKIFELTSDNKLKILDVSCFDEVDVVLRDVDAPLQLSSDEVTFMGYSQLSMNGKKITLIRDLELNKFGIEIVEDNLLYNRELDSYAYLDLRNSVMYYGNSIVKFEPGTLMVKGISGTDTTFYNLEIVQSLLTKVVSNKSIANEILVQLPPDESILIKTKDGTLYDNVYMHPNHSNRNGDWWLNASTLSKKNSNVIFFRDTVKDINMYINYRARVKPVQEGIKTDNSMGTLLNTLKFGGLEIHDSVNPLLQQIIGYDGKFSVYDYNYGITLLYPASKNITLRGNVWTDEGQRNIMKSSEIQKALYRVLDLFKTKDDVDEFIASFHSSSFNIFGNIVLPSGFGVKDETNAGDITTDKPVTLNEYYDSIKHKVKPGLESTVYLSTERYINATEDIRLQRQYDGIDITYENESSIPAKIWNNNFYIRYSDFDKFSSIDKNGAYRFLDTLIFLYQFDRDDKTLTIKHEKVNYDNTPTGYIPLEAWNRSYPIGNYTYLGKIALRGKINTVGNDSEKSYIFDRVIPSKKKSNEGLIFFEIPENAKYNPDSTLLKLKEIIVESNPEFKSALESSEISKHLNTNSNDNKKFLRNYIMKSLDTSIIIDTKVEDSDEGLWAKFVNFAAKTVDFLIQKMGNTVEEIQMWVNNVTKITEDTLKEDFTFTAGKTYVIKPVYLFPSGTTLVNVGEDYYGELKNKDNNYTLEFSPNKTPRVVLGNSFDLLNQNLAQLNDENISIKDIPTGSRVILGSGLELVAIGNREFVIDRGKAFEEGMNSEEVLLWSYLEDMNIRVGTSLNFLNGVENLRIPERTDLVGESKSIFRSIMEDRKVAFVNDNMVSTGKLTEQGISEEDTQSTANAFIYPIAKLNEAVIVTKIMQNKDLQEVYLVRSLGTSVEQEFLQYLREGIVDVNAPLLQNPKVDLASIQTETSEIETFRLKNILIGMSKVLDFVKIGIPLILFGYGMTVWVFLILISVEMVRRFFENFLPDDYLLVFYKFFTLFSIDEVYEIDRVMGFIRATLLLAVSIVWWVIARR